MSQTKTKIEVKIILDPSVNDDEIYDWLHQWMSYDKRIAEFNIESFEWIEEE